MSAGSGPSRTGRRWRSSRPCSTTGQRAAPAAARAPARLHLRAAQRPGAQPALRPGRGRRGARGHQARRRHHLPRSRAARRLPDRAGARSHRRRRARAQRRATGDRRAGDVRCQRRSAAGVPGRVGRRRQPRAAQDLRHRRAPQARPHDARLRPQRGHRHALPARAHRGVRHRRPPGDVAGRGGRARADARRRRRGRPAGRRAVGERRRRAPGRRLAAPCRRPLTVLAWRRSGRAGAPDVTPRRRRRDDGTVDRHAQAGLVAAARPSRAGGDATQAHHPLARPGDGVRGRRVPEPVGVLGRRHGDVHGPRRPLHPRRAGSASSTRGDPRRRRATSPSVSPRRSTAWVSTTPC